MTNQERECPEPLPLSAIIPGVREKTEEDAVFAEIDRIRAEEARKKETEGRQVCLNSECGHTEPHRDQPATKCPTCGAPYEF